MHQHPRDRRNRYLYQLSQLRQIAEITHTELPLLAALVHQMKAANQRQEVSQAQPSQTGDSIR